MSIKVEQLTKLYGKQLAVDHISFDIAEGEIVGFLGPNGAGKSTTMKMITGFIPPNEGAAYVNGKKVDENLELTKSQIGYLPELNPLYLEMFVREYLLFIASTYGIYGADAKEKVNLMIQKTGLLVESNKRISQLSKGYKQRVGLAAAMIHNPKVLILDEPTSGLDPNQVVEIRNLIKDFGKDKTVILSTHIMQEVKAMCNRVIVINKGKIVADDHIDNLQKYLQTAFTILLEVKGTINQELLSKLNGVSSVQHNNNSFEIKANHDVREEIAKLASTHGWLILSMSLKEGSLEEVFYNLTQKKENV